MKVRQCLIIEDDPICADTIKSYLNRLPFFKVVGTYNSYFEAINFITQSQIDLIFLDVILNDSQNDKFTGLDILRTIPNLPATIMMSSYPEFAVESYNIGKSTDYLLKPFNFDRFLLAVNRVLSLNMVQQRLIDEEYIFLKMGRRFQRFNLDDIDYFEAYGIYLKVIVNGIPHVVNDTISGLNERLDVKRFIRVHKSYIVNIQKINGFDHNNLYLKNGKVPIGISYKSQLEGLLRLFDKLDVEQN